MRNITEPVSVNTPTNSRVAPEYGRMVNRTGALYFVQDYQKKKPGKNWSLNQGIKKTTQMI